MKRVLIVDDDRRTRRILQILVERLGFESSAFESAEGALADLEAESAALILTDLKMPGTDGIEFMRRLRRLDEQVPVIVLTAYGTVEAAVEAMKLGAVDFVAKPFDIDALEVTGGPVSLVEAQPATPVPNVAASVSATSTDRYRRDLSSMIISW